MRSSAVKAQTPRWGTWLATLLILGLNVGGYGSGWYHYNQVLAQGFHLWTAGGGDAGLYVRGTIAHDYSLIKAPSVTDWPFVIVYSVVVFLLLWGIWRHPVAPVRWLLGGIAIFFGAMIVIVCGINPITQRLTISGPNHLIVQGARQVYSGQPVELCLLRKISIRPRSGKTTSYVVEGSILSADTVTPADANELVIFDTATSARAFVNDLNDARQAACSR
ncbi:hypothetical protein [Burkholderia plantarii]|uniref:hypothetical protein n=1 Tax=Burkholderia plantarii TaxID=41899 RepID=UPI0018DCAE6E|nr:hypothetical protein [Burkholderia plantarii]MBI0329264.1 hypothetical protein [Burkholderia plantarii]